MLPSFTFHSAGSLIFGRDSVERLGEIAGRLKAGRILIVTDPILVKAGLVERALAPLNAGGVTCEVFAGCVPEPPVEVVRAGVAAARTFRPDAVLGLGGGSNMDAAKLIGLRMPNAFSLIIVIRVPGLCSALPGQW